jgi:isopenicillin N synthase-like dioxygenase
MSPTTSFASIPVIDLSVSSDDAEPQLLSELRNALVNIGFLYVKNHGVPSDVITDMQEALPMLFALSTEEKEEVALEKSPHFLGYSGDGAETTAGQADRREQFEFATELNATWEEGKPRSERLKGPNSVCQPLQ